MNLSSNSVQQRAIGSRFFRFNFSLRILASSLTVLLLVPLSAWPQTRQIERYVYDEAGHVIGIDRELLNGPPEITGIEPGIILGGTEKQFTIFGENLAGVLVDVDRVGLDLSNVQTENSSVSLRLKADAGIAPGPATVTLSSSLGPATVGIEVRAALPRLTVSAAQLVNPEHSVLAEGEARELSVRFDRQDDRDLVLALVTPDSVIAEAMPTELTVPSGQLAPSVPVIVRGLSAGTTELEVRFEEYPDTNEEKHLVSVMRQPLPVQSISAGALHTCALLADRSISCWGYNIVDRQSSPPAGEFTELSEGNPHHNCASRADGTVVCWGDNGDGQSNPPVGEFSQLTAGVSFTCGIRSDGGAQCWGKDNAGQSSPIEDHFFSTSGRSQPCLRYKHRPQYRLLGRRPSWASQPTCG
ncbi:MAG: RCC1 domain-containing protein [Xanthomonadales bacterium]|nr:RCC1 domain-containing protein [Xanthomonadales bacterium]